MAKNTPDGRGKQPKKNPGRKMHGGDKPSLGLFRWFSNITGPKNPPNRRGGKGE